MYTIEEIGRRESADNLRRSLIESGVEHKCYFCSNDGIWLGKKLTLEIDHINGDYLDNNKENLRFLCPNCHKSQCDQWSKLRKNIDKTICVCGNKKHKTSKNCFDCGLKIRSQKKIEKEQKRHFPVDNHRGKGISRPEYWKVPHPTKEELEVLVWEKSTKQIAKDFGVSDNAVGKWCKNYRNLQTS